MQEQVKKMYAQNQLLRMIHNNERIDSDYCKANDLVEKKREVKNEQEYHYLTTVSMQPFHASTIHGYWLEGYPLSVTPIESEEQFLLIQFSMENGDFVSHPFALTWGMDANYQKLLSALGLEAVDKELSNIFVKKCSLLVSAKWEGGERTYFLHDVESPEN